MTTARSPRKMRAGSSSCCRCAMVSALRAMSAQRVAVQALLMSATIRAREQLCEKKGGKERKIDFCAGCEFTNFNQI
jgi:hypothetical protein